MIKAIQISEEKMKFNFLISGISITDDYIRFFNDKIGFTPHTTVNSRRMRDLNVNHLSTSRTHG